MWGSGERDGHPGWGAEARSLGYHQKQWNLQVWSGQAMSRHEKPIDSPLGELGAFANDLRSLRNGVPDLSYRRLAALTDYSPSTLARAASGITLPTLEVVLAYVTACGGDAEAFRARWNALSRGLAAGSLPPVPVVEPVRAVQPRPPRQLPYDVADFVGRLGE